MKLLIKNLKIDNYLWGCIRIQVEVETYWTNLIEDPEEVIKLYHARGTSEQFHSELKNDMGIERLPSGKWVLKLWNHNSVKKRRLFSSEVPHSTFG
jgi:hypothetical protein